MKSKIKPLILSLFILSSFLVSYKAALFAGRTFFFDKLFYQKSTEYGYVKANEDDQSSPYENRNHDIVELSKRIIANKSPDTYKVLGATDDDTYKIAVFGDSYVWGQGIKNDERFVNLLEAKLNKIRKTKIYSFARDGDAIFDNYIKYINTQKQGKNFDLVIIGLVNNDLIFNEVERYDQEMQSKLQNLCPDGKVAYDAQLGEVDYNTLVETSFDPTSRNYCAFKKLLPDLPKDHAIYFDYTAITYPWLTEHLANPIQNAGLTVLSPKAFYESHQLSYVDVFKLNSDQKFQVSPKDGHPSALANRLYADYLFNVLTTDSTWKFKQ